VPELAPLPVLDYPTQSALLSRFIRDLGARRQPLRILEAGCGRKWPLDLGDTRFSLTGVDIDELGLEARRRLEGDLDQAILGDLRTVELPAGDFDVIYSSYVLEHIDGAERVLDNFARWLRDDGLLLIMVPDRDTVWGFVARTTPFWFHVAFKRWIQREPNAGKPGHAPFPTHHDEVVSRRGLHAWSARHGFEVLHEHARQFQPRRFGGLVRAFTGVLALLSLGRLDARYNDLILVLRRRARA
jgi:SAM-dependent methyltransferase